MRPITIGLSALACLTVTTAAAATATSPGRTAPAPEVRPAARTAPSPSGFDHPRPNPWFPLRTGTVWRFRGHEDGHRFIQRTTVTSRHRVVDGVRVRDVRDVVRRADHSLAERTHDWYAVDDRGTVWYFGEATATFARDGHLISREGSWEAGVDGAVAGRIMPLHPRVSDAFRQEYLKGSAEDQGWIVERGARVRTPAVDTDAGVRSLEWSRLEPDVVSQKLYARGYGIVAERDLAGGSETTELIRYRRGR